ncbi:MAG: HNH endonuclease [Alphaproteobacteria bacterium]
MRTPWTRDELIEVLKLYCRTPFGRLHSRNPDITRLAEVIGRTPGAIALKAVNFASMDPTIERKGMSNASALDREVWKSFFDNLDTLIDEPRAMREGRGFTDVTNQEFDATFPEGADVSRFVKTRKNQGFFRDMVLASYDCKCAVSGISEIELLNASHIVPWRLNSGARTNPRNGICLNALHDRAFDRGFISFDEDLKLIYSPKLSRGVREKMEGLGGNSLTLPSRFRPDPTFLEYHRTKFFQQS